MTAKCEKQSNLGQYFTTHILLKETLFSFILNNPTKILEPSIGRGDLIDYVGSKLPSVTFDMYEIDTNIEFLCSIDKSSITFTDFITHEIKQKYTTIIGNPPFVRTKKGNLYVDFIEKCYQLLDNNGELIFIVPYDFFKLTCATKTIDSMMKQGTFTHISHPNNEKLFENASIDVIIFRYCKNPDLDKMNCCLYDNVLKCANNHKGVVTFDKDDLDVTNQVCISEYFDIHVGMVSGKESVFKHDTLGNIDILNGENKVDRYVYLEQFPSDKEELNNYLLSHKDELLSRNIREFNDNNWFEWGALRNMNKVSQHLGKECIYIHNLTRKHTVAFLGTVMYFGGNLLILIPKKPCDLQKMADYLNSNGFKQQFMSSGRFKIGQRLLATSYVQLSNI